MEVSDKVVSVAISPLREPLTYLLPRDSLQTIDIGFKVEVPLGARMATGYVVDSAHHKESSRAGMAPGDLKSIPFCSDNRLCFTKEQLELFRWVAEYHGEAVSRVIESAIPATVPARYQQTIILQECGETALRGTKQKELVEYLRSCGGRASQAELRRRFRGLSQISRRLQETGIIRIDKQELLDQHEALQQAPEWAKKDVALNEAQQAALCTINDTVAATVFKPFLLYGVTGSGKTEVYIEAMRRAVEMGKGVLVIVPEIALTPQLIARFRARLEHTVALLHSALSPRTRWDAWRALLEGRNKIALGARSAIFAPVKNLGLIIVDEEHDSSFKQSDSLRYHARDLALVRGKLENCAVVLGSATPSLETFSNVKSGKCKFLPLPLRYSEAAPVNITLVDMNRIKPWEMPAPNVSPALRDALAETLSAGNQAFILYNRRGFASFLQCDSCNEAYGCPNCSVTLTYHQHSNSLVCHYCNLRLGIPEYCPHCTKTLALTKSAGSDVPLAMTENSDKPGKLLARGAGTEKIFDELCKLFPQAKIDRLDSDSASDFATYKTILDRVRSGETQILVGTQMIAKGHDLPGVTLVGIADSDVGLHMPDFRAGERVFQLLTQASGRCGRASQPGQVILQTRVPMHRSLVMTVNKDYAGFAEIELAARQRLNYPPYSRMLRVIASCSEKELALALLTQLRDQAQQFSSQRGYALSFLGPAPAALQKLKTQWRFHFLVKGKSPAVLSQLVTFLRGLKIKTRKVRVAYDLDPQEML